jgi:hypothetical protein
MSLNFNLKEVSEFCCKLFFYTIFRWFIHIHLVFICFSLIIYLYLNFLEIYEPILLIIFNPLLFTNYFKRSYSQKLIGLGIILIIWFQFFIDFIKSSTQLINANQDWYNGFWNTYVLSFSSKIIFGQKSDNWFLFYFSSFVIHNFVFDCLFTNKRKARGIFIFFLCVFFECYLPGHGGFVAFILIQFVWLMYITDSWIFKNFINDLIFNISQIIPYFIISVFAKTNSPKKLTIWDGKKKFKNLPNIFENQKITEFKRSKIGTHHITIVKGKKIFSIEFVRTGEIFVKNDNKIEAYSPKYEKCETNMKKICLFLKKMASSHFGSCVEFADVLENYLAKSKKK